MDQGRIDAALERSERALARIESLLAGRSQDSDGGEALRRTVRQAVEELDRMIRETEG